MALEDHLKDLVIRFKEVLDSNERILNCFCKYGVQMEGWLKGELLYFLDNEKNVGRIAHFDREVLTGIRRKRVNLKIKVSTSSGALEAWIELKHWLVGYQREIPYNAQFYFGDSSSVGIKPDAEKLSEISNDSKFLLILTTANPVLMIGQLGLTSLTKSFLLFALKA
jgi:hypothetical protein